MVSEQAQRIIQEMMGGLGLTEKELRPTRKSDWRKRVIAQRVRQETSVSLRWLGGRLAMGSEGHVSRLSSSVEDLAKHPTWHAFQKTRVNVRKKGLGFP